jgi:hypothetical protein
MILFPRRNLLFVVTLLTTKTLFARVTLNKYDPAPPFTSAFSHAFLYTQYKECLKEHECLDDEPLFCVDISPFFQHASIGTDIHGNQAELGDLTGRLNMIAALTQGGIIGRNKTQLSSVDFFNSNADVPAGMLAPAGLVDIRNNLITCLNDVITFNRQDGSKSTTSGSVSTTHDPNFPTPASALLNNVTIINRDGISYCFGTGFVANTANINQSSRVDEAVSYAFPDDSPVTTVDGLLSIQQGLTASYPDLPVFPSTTGGTPSSFPCNGFKCTPDLPFSEIIGFFSIPQEYSKRGVRLEIDGKFCKNLGFRVTGGVARVTNLVRFDDQTIATQCPTACDGTSTPGSTTQFKAVNHYAQTPTLTKQTVVTNIYVQSEFISGSGPFAIAENPACNNLQNNQLTTTIYLPDIPVGPPYISLSDEPLIGSDNCADECRDNKIPRWQALLQCIHHNLMNQFTDVSRAVGVNPCNYNETSLEDIYAEIFWRRAFIVNKNAALCGQPKFLFIPFVTFGGSLGVGKPKDQNMLFAVPVGNNGHNSAYATAGFSFDFYDTIEVGFDAGFTHFFTKRFCNYRIPTNPFQNILYPFATDAEVSPGKTWFTEAFIYGHNIIDQLSLYARYQFVAHERDSIKVLNEQGRRIIARKPNGTVIKNTSNLPQEVVVPSPFMPEVLECKTPWSAHLLDIGGTYALSPNFAMGILAQIPLTQKNASQSTTFMATFEISY